MTRIVSEITIARPVEEVYDFATAPANWVRWHPSTLRVDGDAGHPQDVGETCTEEFVVAGRRGVTDWIVTRRERPALWTIASRPSADGKSAGGSATITYQLAPAGSGGTRFTRTLEYAMTNPLTALLNVLVLRRRVDAESRQALANLRDVLEKEGSGVSAAGSAAAAAGA